MEYSLIPITQTLTGNCKKFALSRMTMISKKMTWREMNLLLVSGRLELTGINCNYFKILINSYSPSCFCEGKQKTWLMSIVYVDNNRIVATSGFRYFHLMKFIVKTTHEKSSLQKTRFIKFWTFWQQLVQKGKGCSAFLLWISLETCKQNFIILLQT